MFSVAGKERRKYGEFIRNISVVRSLFGERISVAGPRRVRHRNESNRPAARARYLIITRGRNTGRVRRSHASSVPSTGNVSRKKKKNDRRPSINYNDSNYR